MTDNEKMLQAQIEREHYVYMRNELINDMEYHLTRQQLLLLRYMIKQIKKTDTPDTVYTISIRNFCKLLNIDASGQVYKDIKKTFYRIASQVKWIETNDEINMVQWFSKITIKKKLGTIEYRFHEAITPYLFELMDSNGYTKYLFEDAVVIETKHGIRLYEFLREHYNANRKYIRVSIDYLMQLIAGDTNYKEFKYFNRDVLKKAVEEINRCQYFNVTYRCMTSTGSRAFTHIRFTFVDIEEDSIEYYIISDERNKRMELPIPE